MSGKMTPEIKQIVETGRKNDGAFKGNMKERPMNISLIDLFTLRHLTEEKKAGVKHPIHLSGFNSSFDFQSCGSKPGERFRWGGRRVHHVIWKTLFDLRKMCNYIILKIQIVFGKLEKSNLSSM